jgi:YD repeat-containing protein
LIEESDSENRGTKYYYYELNRQTTIKDAVGGITLYTYDNNGKTKSILDADSNLTSYFYDTASRLIKEQTRVGDRTYTYDSVDNRISATDRNHRTTAYTYDNLNRVRTETWQGDGKQFTYTYDQNSNLTSADDGNRHYTYTYDNTDLLQSSATIPIVSFKYDHDSVGNITQTKELIAVSTTSIFTADNTYETYGRLIEIKQTNATGVITDRWYGFDNLSRLTSENTTLN